MQDDPRQPLKDALDTWAGVTIRNTEDRLRIQMTRALISISEPTDRYSSWAMIGVGGGLVAVISSLSEIQELLGYCTLRLALLLAVGSLAFGLLQRAVAAHIQISLSSELAGEKLAREEMQEHKRVEGEIQRMAEESGLEVNTSVDFIKAYEASLDLLPQPYRWIAGKVKVRIIKDPKYMHRRLVRAVFRQSWYVLSQVLLAIAAIGVVASGV